MVHDSIKHRENHPGNPLRWSSVGNSSSKAPGVGLGMSCGEEFNRADASANDRMDLMSCPASNTIVLVVLLPETLMATTMTVKGQVTIPKKVRDALRLSPGDGVDFNVNRGGEVVVHKAGA